MKVKISVLALIAVLFLSLTAANALAANSFNFLGETTWTVTINEREGGAITPFDITMTGAISKLGSAANGSYYLFQGVVQIPDDNPFFLAGAGTLVTLPGAQTQTLVLTLNTSQLHVDSQNASERDTGIMHVEINPSTLGGSFYEIGHDFNKFVHTFDQPRFTAGIITHTGAPVPLSPSSTTPLMNLLLE